MLGHASLGPLHGKESLKHVIETCRATGRANHAEWLEKNGTRPVG